VKHTGERWTLHVGDVRERLAELPDESVHCVVTSPPFWGLRDYGVDGQMGLEATPEEFIAGMVAVFREVRRVLRRDGVCWVEMGDCYATGAGSVRNCPGGGPRGQTWTGPTTQPNRMPLPGLKPKDLVGMPWRLALALQADGWWLRSDVVWSKPSPMPESVTDRPTKAHSYVFLLTKAARYFYDSDAVRENDSGKASGNGFNGRQGGTRTSAINGGKGSVERFAPGSGRNLRTVWTIPTEAFPGAHFATFPRRLVEPCVKAGTSERGCCPQCGAPWERVVEIVGEGDARGGRRKHADVKARQGSSGALMTGRWSIKGTFGWRPTCTHDAPPVPCTVLDPFAGAGTTGVVALSHGRRFVGVELNPDYAEMARRRLVAFDLGERLPPPVTEQADDLGPLFGGAADPSPDEEDVA
jgi:DNA modification methylase